MRATLSRLPVDTFLLLLVAVVALATVLPARGAAADVLSVATKVVIALLFLLYGARLSPQQAWHGMRQWKLHLLVLATTFVAFPLLGLAARALVPSVLTEDLYAGLLFLCLVPSTVQSSIAFTSMARGHVSAAIVSASLSNILGVLLTPLLVLVLMPIGGAPRVDGSAVLDIVLQLLAPFAVGQLLRPWLAPVVTRHAGADQGGRPRLDPADRLRRVLGGDDRAHLEQCAAVAGGGRRGGQHPAAGHRAGR